MGLYLRYCLLICILQNVLTFYNFLPNKKFGNQRPGFFIRLCVNWEISVYLIKRNKYLHEY